MVNIATGFTPLGASVSFDVSVINPLRQDRLTKPATATDVAAPGRLCWGRVGSMPSAELAPTVNFEVVHCNETHVETRRVDTVQRIANKNDPESWVDVKRPTTIHYNKIERNNAAPDNSSEGAGGFWPSPAFQALPFSKVDFGSGKNCKYSVTLANGPDAA